MKSLIALTLGLFFGMGLYAQDNQVRELTAKGVELFDQGKYDEAIAKYKEALSIDKNSTVANYELAYTYMVIKKYEEGVKYSTIVIEQNTNNIHESYGVLGSCLDMLGEPKKAIATFKEGLKRFPNSNLLNYNLAVTAYNQKDYDEAEMAAINAILAKPSHGSSHAMLASIMKSKGLRVKSLLPTYYFLMLEPNSRRSPAKFNNLITQLGEGVEKTGEGNIDVEVSLNSSNDNEFDNAEMMLGLLAASRNIEEEKGKSDMEMFVEITKAFFEGLGEIKGEHNGFWWDFYVAKFSDLVKTRNCEAFCYYISQSLNSEVVNKWTSDNKLKMKKLENWLNQ
jgi:tetratricopeptide (TPR) repeat protein